MATDSVTILIHGMQGCGQSHFMASMAMQLHDVLPTHFGLIEQIDGGPLVDSTYLQSTSINLAGMSLGDQPSVSRPSLLTLNVSDSTRDLMRRRVLRIAANDAYAGSTTSDEQLTHDLALANVILYLFDPTQCSPQPSDCDDSLGQSQLKQDQQADEFLNLSHRLRHIRKLAPDKSHAIPLVVVMTKLDAVLGVNLNADLFSAIVDAPDQVFGSLNLQIINQMSDRTREALHLLSPSFGTAVQSQWSDVTYIPTSSLGFASPSTTSDNDTREAKNRRPIWTAVPLLYALHRLNPSLIPASSTNEGNSGEVERLAVTQRSVANDSSDSAEPLRIDDNVQFTVYRPRVVQPQEWFSLLAFAHLDELPHGSNDPDPLEEVKQQAEASLGEQIEDYNTLRQDSTHAIPKQGELSFVPQVQGCQFNPPRQTIQWEENVHKVEFRFKAQPSLVGTTARGGISVFLGAILVADIPLRFVVDTSGDSKLKANPAEAVSAKPYRKIFASYSHQDIAIVKQFEKFANSLGDRYLRDWNEIRSGEKWGQRIIEMIEEADVFQLFWSYNSMRSPYVRREWEHAISLTRKGPSFVRPTYWESPMPEEPEKELPPARLRELHFTCLAPALVDQAYSQDEIEVDDEESEQDEEDVMPDPECEGNDDGEVKEPPYQLCYLSHHNQNMQVGLSPESLNPNLQRVLAFRSDDLKSDELERWLREAHCMIGSADKLDKLIEYRMPGLKIKLRTSVPQQIPLEGEWLFFDMDEDDQAWREIIESRTLAMRFSRQNRFPVEMCDGSSEIKVSFGDRNASILCAILVFSP